MRLSCVLDAVRPLKHEAAGPGRAERRADDARSGAGMIGLCNAFSYTVGGIQEEEPWPR